MNENYRLISEFRYIKVILVIEKHSEFNNAMRARNIMNLSSYTHFVLLRDFTLELPVRISLEIAVPAGMTVLETSDIT